MKAGSESDGELSQVVVSGEKLSVSVPRQFIARAPPCQARPPVQLPFPCPAVSCPPGRKIIGPNRERSLAVRRWGPHVQTRCGAHSPLQRQGSESLDLASGESNF